jgi:hypothetical protein
MSLWIDIACFCIVVLGAPLTILHLWAFIWPDGKISKRLHPSPLPPSPPPPSSITDNDREFLTELASEEANRIIQELRPPPQPDPLEDLELVTTVRRSPRRR